METTTLSSLALCYRNKSFALRNPPVLPTGSYPAPPQDRTSSKAALSTPDPLASQPSSLPQAFLKQLCSIPRPAEAGGLTWLRLRGCTPLVTTRWERYPVGVMQHPDDCPLTEATGLLLLLLLRMPARCHKLSPLLPLPGWW